MLTGTKTVLCTNDCPVQTNPPAHYDHHPRAAPRATVGPSANPSTSTVEMKGKKDGMYDVLNGNENVRLLDLRRRALGYRRQDAGVSRLEGDGDTADVDEAVCEEELVFVRV